MSTATLYSLRNGELDKKVVVAPVGAIFFFPVETPPEYTLECNGAAISRSAYAELFALIGTKHGAGDGTTTFNLPDLRGKFIRGTGGNAAALGVAQGDAIRNITGEVFKNGGAGPLVLARISELSQTGALAVTSERTTPYSVAGEAAPLASNCSFDASRIVPTAAENRPVNVALLPCIVYK